MMKHGLKKSLLDERKGSRSGWARTSKQLMILLLVSFILAFFSHLFYVKQWAEDVYMLGMNDGLSQILPFKRLLYDMYTNGEFFYSYELGMGAGTYSQLGYYYSTSIVFIISVAITFFLECVGLIDSPDLLYWADAILVISIIRMTLILMITYGTFRYINIQKVPSFVGATIYGTSVIYFRHVQYWEFFADAMIWLPILLFGIEKIIREKKAGWFITAVAISVFDNFYFAYINFLLAAIYIIFRWIIPFSCKEQHIFHQVKQYILGGLCGIGIGAVSFIPAVYGYLNNYRPSYDGPIPLFAFPDNILLDGRIIVLPAFSIICLFLFALFKNRIYRFFSCLTILTIFMHYSAMVASIFNGFSAPQYRWEYFMAYVAGALVAISLSNLHRVSKKGLILSGLFTLCAYLYFYNLTDLTIESLYNFNIAYLVIPAAITIIIVVMYGINHNKVYHTILPILLISSSIFISYGYQKVKLSHAGTKNEVSAEVIVGDTYNGPDTNSLISKIKKYENDPFYRIEWMYPTRNNTPITQRFNGFSAYSSILNKDLLYFYYFNLDIDMGRESLSRYGTLGDRSNLYSILGGKYYISHKGDTSIPFGFEKAFTSGDYIAYQNKNILPFIRTTRTVFAEKDLANSSPIAKEHAMIKGVILPTSSSNSPIPKNEDLLKYVEIIPIGSTYHNGVLHVKSEMGGIDLVIDDRNPSIKDYYVSFFIKSLEKDHFFELSVNDYKTSRKSNMSIYRTGDNDLSIRIAADDKISFRMPEGKYKLANLKLFGEDYEVLESAKEDVQDQPHIPMSISGNVININYNNGTEETYMMVPIPYEKGWQVYINGSEKKVWKANYAFIGIELEEGENEIRLVYYPPYFFISLWISILSLLLAFLPKLVRQLVAKHRHTLA
ncbi:MAG TPA: YfhO family protein [Bacillaceae bacterium]|nr:YfhO family protein [Bacillaceae bacterium]